jgi:hypothetical protein
MGSKLLRVTNPRAGRNLKTRHGFLYFSEISFACRASCH